MIDNHGKFWSPLVKLLLKYKISELIKDLVPLAFFQNPFLITEARMIFHDNLTKKLKTINSQ